MTFQDFYAEVDRLLAGVPFCINLEVWNHRNALPLVTWKVWDSAGHRMFEASTPAGVLDQIRGGSEIHALPADLPGQE